MHVRTAISNVNRAVWWDSQTILKFIDDGHFAISSRYASDRSYFARLWIVIELGSEVMIGGYDTVERGDYNFSRSCGNDATARRMCTCVNPHRAKWWKHLEGRRRQYERVEWAAAAGWPRERIMVIDEDQGKSARTARTRGGFAQLVAAVAQGEVGIVVALEVTRLSRNSPDWHHLLYLCRFTETLIG